MIPHHVALQMLAAPIGLIPTFDPLPSSYITLRRHCCCIRQPALPIGFYNNFILYLNILKQVSLVHFSSSKSSWAMNSEEHNSAVFLHICWVDELLLIHYSLCFAFINTTQILTNDFFPIQYQ